MTTTITIPEKELRVFAGQPVLIGTHIMDKLKAQGVPVVGALWPVGVSSGEMRVTMNSTGMTYEWDGVEEDEQLF